ncbi:MAG: ATP-dependent RNA helicase RhlB, partial [Halioglobus sp.]
MIKSLFGRKTATHGSARNDRDSVASPTQSEEEITAVADAPKAANPASGQKKRGRNNKHAKNDAKPWSVSDFPVDPKEGEVRFHDLGLRDEVMRGIADIGFKYCSPIQGS